MLLRIRKLFNITSGLVMFFIFSVLPIKDILKIRNRLVNEYFKGVFNNLSCTRQSVTENTFIKVEVISPRKRS